MKLRACIFGQFIGCPRVRHESKSTKSIHSFQFNRRDIIIRAYGLFALFLLLALITDAKNK